MAIWKNRCSVKELNDKLSGSVQQSLGFNIAHIGDDFLVATLPMANNLDPEQQKSISAGLMQH